MQIVALLSWYDEPVDTGKATLKIREGASVVCKIRIVNTEAA